MKKVVPERRVREIMIEDIQAMSIYLLNKTEMRKKYQANEFKHSKRVESFFTAYPGIKDLFKQAL